MTEAANIRPHEHGRLVHEIRTLQTRALSRRIWSGLMLTNVDVGDIKIKIPVVNIGNVSPTRLWRRVTKTARFREAATEWLRPDPSAEIIGALTHENLPALRRRVTLDHWQEVEFARELQVAILDLVNEFPQLRLWAECRNALLDYVVHPPRPLPADLVGAMRVLEQSLFLLAYSTASMPADVIRGAADGLQKRALGAASQVCCSILSRENSAEPTDYSANMMLPVAAREVDAMAAHAEGVWLENYRRALELWDGIVHDSRLLIVSESSPGHGGNSHLGFWVPIARGTDGRGLPGAASALVGQAACAVFKDDLPEIKGFPAEIGLRWAAYMTKHFERKLFISLPTMMSKGHGVPPKPCAVLNLNVTPAKGDRTWKRAYHQVWLDEASDAVSMLSRWACWAARMTAGVGMLQTLNIDVDLCPKPSWYLQTSSHLAIEGEVDGRLE